MARPAQVEFPGQKRQKVRLRGTKHANEATAKKLKKDLTKLLENPNAHLPEMLWKGKMRWGRTDPVTKTLKILDGIIAKKYDTKWLSKRMMAKRGDPVAKAFAGSLHACHDEEFTTVGKFSSASFGSASFVRRGDGKQGYLAGLQNYSNVTLRMLPWEEHAKRGMYFFSWKGGFVCTGPKPSPPIEWVEDVVARSRFDFKQDSIEDKKIWLTDSIDFNQLENGLLPNACITFSFKEGPSLYIGFDELESGDKKDTSFIQHLALSMLPPFLPTIGDNDANWSPEGWPEEKGLPSQALEGVEKILDAWQGLVMNEGVVAQAIRRSVLDSIEEGLIINAKWYQGNSFEEIRGALDDVAGSNDERDLAAHILLACYSAGFDDDMGLRINTRGETSERKTPSLEIIEGASCGDVLGVLWEEFGLEALGEIGIVGEESEEIWHKQNTKPKPFGKFLKSLDSAREKAKLSSLIPTKLGELEGACGHIVDLIRIGLLEGLGKAERVAISRHSSISEAAASWAWLLAAERSSGQEWHFDSDARNKASAWMSTTKYLLETGKELLACSNDEVKQLQKQWFTQLAQLKKDTGEA